MAEAGAASTAWSQTTWVKSAPWHPLLSQNAPSGQMGGVQLQGFSMGRGTMTHTRSPVLGGEEGPEWQDNSSLTGSTMCEMMGTEISLFVATTTPVPSTKESTGPHIIPHTFLTRGKQPQNELSSTYISHC